MNASAQNMSDSTQWDLAQWKKWLQFYESVLQNFASIGGASLGNDTVFWKPEFDSMNLTDVLSALNQTGQLGEFLGWYEEFFGADGLVTQNKTIAMANNDVSQTITTVTSGIVSNTGLTSTPTLSIGGIPAGMEAIVDWISKNTDYEVRLRCLACQMEGSNVNITKINETLVAAQAQELNNTQANLTQTNVTQVNVTTITTELTNITSTNNSLSNSTTLGDVATGVVSSGEQAATAAGGLVAGAVGTAAGAVGEVVNDTAAAID